MKTKRKMGQSYQQQLILKIKSHYRSLLLGLLSVGIALTIISALVPLKNISSLLKGKVAMTRTENKNTQEKQKSGNKTAEKKTYKVLDGDSLWIIAEKFYNSGYKAFDIAKANNISNPDSIEVDQVIILPDLQDDSTQMNKNGEEGEITSQAVFTKQDKSIKKYTVKTGDHLWKIAQETYGDGNQWERIARVNNLVYPSIIHSGNILTIPL